MRRLLRLPPFAAHTGRVMLALARRRIGPFLRAGVAIIGVVLFVGGIPGSVLRTLVYDIALPSVSSDAQGRAAVLVTVRGGSGGPPIVGANLRAFALVDDLSFLADARETDKTGSALLAGLPYGPVWIMADARGRARGSTRFVVDTERREIEIDLEPEHVFDVVVKDDGAAAIVAAEVEVLSSTDPLPVGARAGSDGRAHVSRLGAGPWRVVARAAGYEEGGGRASNDGEVVTIVLRKLGSFAVHVVGEDDKPVAGARVLVAGAMLWPARAAESNAEGDVRIGGLATGLYALRASSQNLVSAIELGIALGRGEEKRVLLKVVPGHWISVHVTDGDADDAAGIVAARVTLAEGGLSPFPIEAITDTKGHARLGPIASGAATLSVRADGFVARGIALPDAPPAETRVALVRAGVLDGRVVDDRGYPIDGATVEIIGTDANGAPILDDPRRASFQAAHFDAMLGGPAPLLAAGQLGVMPGRVPPIPQSGGFAPAAGADARTLPSGSVGPRGPPEVEPWVTRSDGTFRATPASPGRLRAIVRHPQYIEAESDAVTLAPGGVAHVDVVMHGGGSLEGRVIDSRDRPVEGARVMVSAIRGSLDRATRTASDGTFAFAALPDEVSLTTNLDDGTDQPDIRMAITIPERGRKVVTIRLPEPRGALAVRVVDDRDFPIATAQVTASSLSVDLPLRTTAFTDAHGDASLRRARGLPLRVEASAPGYAPRVISVDGSGESLRIELAPAESMTGEVIAAQGGNAIAGAEVVLYTDLGVRRARSDAQGGFSLNELAPGGASLRVRATGFADASRSVAIPDSAGRRPFAMPRIELLAEGAVDGDVVDARGNPAAGARVARDHAPTWLVAGGVAEGVAITDAKGHFWLGGLAEGTIALEAYAPDLGRARIDGVKIAAGRTTSNVHIALERSASEQERSGALSGGGSIAVTLGETGTPVQVVVVSVAAGSEAEHAGLAPGDVVLAVDEAMVHTMTEAREKLGGPLSDDVVVRVHRGDRDLSVRVTREPIRR